MSENFRDKCHETYEPDPVYFVSAPGLPSQACLKKAGVKLELLTDYNMLLMVQNRIRGGICQAVHKYGKANNTYMRNYGKNIKLSYLAFLDANNLYGWAMSQKLPVNGLEWVEEKGLSKFNEDFIKKYDENRNIRYFLEVDVDYLKMLFNSHKEKEKRKVCNSRKSFKTGTKSWLKTKRGTQSNSV